MLWLGLIVLVIGGFIYIVDKKMKAKFEDKFNPTDWGLPRAAETSADTKPRPVATPGDAVKLGYTKKLSLFTENQRHIFNALQQALANEYILLAKVNAADVLDINANNNVLASQVAAKNLASKQFDFVVCDKDLLTAVCAVSVGESLEPLLVKACEHAHLPLARFNIEAGYDVDTIRSSLLRALGRAEIVTPAFDSALDIVDEPIATSLKKTAGDVKELDQIIQHQVEIKEDQTSIKTKTLIEGQAKSNGRTDSAIKIEICPECAAVMLKRKAKSGALAGQALWICSTYPKCRKMIPVK